MNNILARRHVWLLALPVILSMVAALPVHAQEPSPPPDSRLQDALSFLAANEIPASAFRDLSAAGGDPQRVTEVLARNGFTPEQIQAFATPENLFVLDQAVNPNPTAVIVAEATEIGGRYGLEPADVAALLPLASDQPALMEALAQRGLTEEQIGALLGEIDPLIQQAILDGDLKYVPTLTAYTAFVQLGLPDPDLSVVEIAGFLDEPDALTTYFKGQGLDDQQIEVALGTVDTLVSQGLSKNLIVGALVRTAIHRLEGMGLSPQLLDDLVAPANLDVVRERLVQEGLSGDALALALVHLEGAFGFHGEKMNATRLSVFLASEAANLLNSARIVPTDLDEILSKKDDPDALRAWLAEKYYLDETSIDAFILGLNQSSFAKTLAPEDVEDIVARIEGSGSGYITDIPPIGEYGDEYADEYGEDVIVVTEEASSDSSDGN
jgi:hypothetical protein